MAIRVAINGFGRIGRLVMRAAMEHASRELERGATGTGPEKTRHGAGFDGYLGGPNGRFLAHFRREAVGCRLGPSANRGIPGLADLSGASTYNVGFIYSRPRLDSL